MFSQKGVSRSTWLRGVLAGGAILWALGASAEPAAAQDRTTEACRAYVSAGGAVPVAPTSDPDEVERLVSAALQASLLEDHETAGQLLQRARRLAPSDPDVAYYMGRAQVAAGDSANAIASYCAYLNLAPNAPDRAVVQATVAGLLDGVPAPSPAVEASAPEGSGLAFGRLEILAVVGVLLAILLALLAAGTDGSRVLTRARAYLAERRQRRVGSIAASARRGVSEAWLEHGLRDRGSPGRRLERLSEALERLGDREIATLERLEARLAAGARALTRVMVRRDTASGERSREGELIPRGGDSVAIVVMLAIVAVAVVALNTILLHDAVAQALPAPSSLTGVDVALLVALGLGIAALGAGLLWYALESVEAASLHTLLFKLTPFLLVFGLTTVQVLAYTVVSGRLDIPGRLDVEPGTMLYPVLSYLVVLIGGLIPLSLATTGYSLFNGLQRARVATSERRLQRALADRPEETLARIAEHTERFHHELIHGFRDAAGIGGEDEESVALIVREEITALQRTAPAAVAVRPTTEVLGPFLLDLGVVAAWALVVGHAFQLFSRPGGGLDPVAWGIAALAAALAVTAAGIVAKRVLFGRAGLGTTPSLPRGRPGKLVLGFAAACGLLGGLLLLALAYGLQPLSSGPTLNLLYGGLLTLLLALAAAALDDAILALATLLRMTGHGSVWLLAEIAAGASFVAEAALATLALVASGGAGSRREGAGEPDAAG
ncbi:MAG: hypothetical protein ABFS34_02830 [Gemmatimonadota bacterium]